MYANKVSDTNAYDASLAQLHPHMTNWLTSVEVPMWKIQIQIQKIQNTSANVENTNTNAKNTNTNTPPSRPCQIG